MFRVPVDTEEVRKQIINYFEHIIYNNFFNVQKVVFTNHAI